MLKRLGIALSILAVFACLSIGREPSKYDGNTIDGYIVKVDTFVAGNSVNAVITSAYLYKNGGVTIVNKGPYSVYIDSYTDVNTTDGNMGFELEKGDEISADGKIEAQIYGKALTQPCTLQVFIVLED